MAPFSAQEKTTLLSAVTGLPSFVTLPEIVAKVALSGCGFGFSPHPLKTTAVKMARNADSFRCSTTEQMDRPMKCLLRE
jgi:hypothetical protein